MDEAARGRVWDAAEELFGARGWFRVGLDEVARGAGVELSDVEAEFGDRDQLLVRLAQQRAHEVRTRLHRAVEGLGSRTAMEGAGFQEWFRWLSEHPYTNQIIWQVELVDPDVHRMWYRDLAADYVRGLTRAIDDGELPRADPEALAWILMGMGDFIGMRYVTWTDATALQQDVMKTFLRAVTKVLQTGGTR